MDLTACPHCGLRVNFSGDCVCPGCEQEVSAETLDAAADRTDTTNPFQSPKEANILPEAPASPGLTFGEQIFAAIVILFAGFVLLGLALFHFLIIPGAKDPNVLYFVVSLYWLSFATLAVTTYLNLRNRRLLVIPTCLQCLLLCLTVWLIPAGIAGFYLLHHSQKRNKR